MTITFEIETHEQGAALGLALSEMKRCPSSSALKDYWVRDTVSCALGFGDAANAPHSLRMIMSAARALRALEHHIRSGQRA